MNIDEGTTKALGGIGLFIGTIVGIAVAGTGSGTSGLATIACCAFVGMVGFPLGVFTLAALGIGIYSLAKIINNLRKKESDQIATPTLSQKPEPTSGMTPSAALISKSLAKSSSETMKTKVSSPKPDATLATTSRPSQHASFANRCFAFFTRCFGSVSTSVGQGQAQELSVPANKR